MLMPGPSPVPTYLQVLTSKNIHAPADGGNLPPQALLLSLKGLQLSSVNSSTPTLSVLAPHLEVMVVALRATDSGVSR